MYYKEKLTKNLADLNTFETSMSLRDRVTTSKNLTPLLYLHMYTLPSSGSEVLRSYTYTGREITMTSLGNIALSLKDHLMSLKSDYNVYFSLSSSLFGSKSFLRLVLLLTRLFSSSSDVGVKNLANSLTWDGPMRLRGSS